MTLDKRSVAPTLEPVPVEGCGVCGALAAQREEARQNGKAVTVRECNAELRNHPHCHACGLR